MANMTAEELLPVVIKTAKMVCADQPEVPEPETLKDLDSFSLVQMALELEVATEVKLLEQLENFRGETFEDLAEFIATCAASPQDGDLAGEGGEAAASSELAADGATSQDQTAAPRS